MNLVALGVGLGAPGVHLAWVLLPASGALKICHNSNFYVARFLAQAHMFADQTQPPSNGWSDNFHLLLHFIDFTQPIISKERSICGVRCGAGDKPSVMSTFLLRIRDAP